MDIRQQDRTGKKIRLILVGDRFYSGVILSEDSMFITIRDKFGSTVQLNKNSIISLEELQNG